MCGGSGSGGGVPGVGAGIEKVQRPIKVLHLTGGLLRFGGHPDQTGQEVRDATTGTTNDTAVQ